jgi:hypothetical protein
MSYSEKFYIAIIQFQDFETSICVIIKQSLLYIKNKMKAEK